MKIKELIEKLQQYDQDLDVMLVAESCSQGTIIEINSVSGEDEWHNYTFVELIAEN